MPISIPEHEIEITAIRSGGPGGQHVNKVATGIQLRFDIKKSSLKADLKEKLLQLKDKRLTNEGVIVIKSTHYRSQQKNREEAIKRLNNLIQDSSKKVKKRIPTKATKASRENRLKQKGIRSDIKKNRRKIDF
ncbi:MAG: alternative ribosome rescue aminoacyl-tRNA hydrolase ArfB [Bacteroidota bacterium]